METDLEVELRTATPEDRERIFAFLEQAYGRRSRYKYPERWEWLYRLNPYIPAGTVPVWLATVGDLVIAQSCYMYVPLKVGATSLVGAHGCDLIVAEPYRRQSIGRELQAFKREAISLEISLWSTPINSRILEQLGYTPVHKPVILELDLRRTTSFLSVPLEVLDVQAFGTEADQIWQCCHSGYPALVRRESQYLNWKYTAQPNMSYEKYVFMSGGTPSAYVVLRMTKPPEPSAGIISDFFCHHEDERSLLGLIGFACARMRALGASRVVTATNRPDFRATFEKLGFEPRGAVTAYCHCATNAAYRASALQPGNWFLTRSDSDWDQYPLF